MAQDSEIDINIDFIVNSKQVQYIKSDINI